MAPLSTKSLTHFTHPSHRLTQLTTNTTYNCDGCKIAGTGTRFTCTTCSFNLHDYCAECPTRLAITTNHPHPLSLIVHSPKLNRTQPCQICHNPVQGLSYQCTTCNFLVHPVCVLNSSGFCQDHANCPGCVSRRIDAQDAAELATNLGIEDDDYISFETSNASETTDTSGSHYGGRFEAFCRKVGVLFESSSA